MVQREELIKKIDADVKRIMDSFRNAIKYMILFRGKGIEFANLRKYIEGEDDASRIDWMASQRARSLYIREYEEEKDLDIYVLLSAHATMSFGTQNMLKSEYAASVAGVLTYAGIEIGNNVGFAMFNDRVIHAMEPSNDRSRYYRILDLATDERLYRGGCNLPDALDYCLRSINKRTFVFIISDFLGLRGDWKHALNMVSHRMDRVLGIMIRDIRDLEIPSIGYMRLADPVSGTIAGVDTKRVAERYRKLAYRQEQDVMQSFLESKADIIRLLTTDSFAEGIIKYLGRLAG